MKSVEILKELLLMIKNVQCLNVHHFHSIFYLDSDFVQVQFKGTKIKPQFVVRCVYLLSVIREIQNNYSSFNQDFDPFKIIFDDEILTLNIGKKIQSKQISLDFSMFQNIISLLKENNQEISQLVLSICIYLPPEIHSDKDLFQSTQDKFTFLSNLLSLSYLMRKEESLQQFVHSNSFKKFLNPQCQNIFSSDEMIRYIQIVSFILNHQIFISNPSVIDSSELSDFLETFCFYILSEKESETFSYLLHHFNLFSSNSFIQPILLKIEYFFKILAFLLETIRQLILRI
jgi:hypothetical protein